jgi:hypothetical protein
MLPVVREKLFGMEFDNLGQLSHRLSLMSNQAYGFKKTPGLPNTVIKLTSTTNSSKELIKERNLMMKRNSCS